MSPDIGLPLILLGATLLWSVRIAYGARRGTADDWLKHCLTVAGWLMLLLGTEILAGMFALVPLFLMVPVFWVIVLATIHFFRQGEQQSLIWMLSHAAERDLPLSPSVRAFAQERTDEVGFRAWRLAEALDAGMPLDLAMLRAKFRPTLPLLVAARVGQAYGVMPAALRSAVLEQRGFDRVLRNLVERLLFMLTAIFVFALILSFVMIIIIPTFEKMFKEFELDLPRITKLVIALSQMAVTWWSVGAPVYLLIWLALMLGFLHYVGWLPWNFPGLGWLRLRYDRTVVLRTLALTVDQKRPIDHALATLEFAFPTTAIRRRLAKALLAVRQGSDWPEALQRAGLISGYEQAVLASAERVGNVAWALQMLAENGVRRLTQRLRVITAILTSIAFCGFSLLVLMFAAAIIMPLASLIWNLS